MITRYLTAASLTLMLAALAPPAGAAILLDPSFDCRIATGTVEQIICHDSNLAEADRDLNQTYEATAAETGIDPKRLRHEEDIWLLARNKCTTNACVAAAYASRKTQLLAIEARTAAGAAATVPAQRLALPAIAPGARIMGVSLAISGGRLAALATAPPGWQFIIDNDPAGQTTISAHAIVGAASINANTLGGLFLIAATPSGAGAATPPSVSGSVTTMAGGVLKTSPLTGLALQPPADPPPP